jgi:hypothetical protein
LIGPIALLSFEVVMVKPVWFVCLLVPALLLQPLTPLMAQTGGKPSNKKKKAEPPLSLFRQKPAKTGKVLLYSDLRWTPEIHSQPVTDWTDHYELSQFLAAEIGGKKKALTKEEKVLVAADDLFGKFCLVMGALGALGLTQRKK